MELTLTSWAVAMGGLWVLFSRSEKVVSPDARNAITRWLKNLKVEGTLENWPSTFAEVFDSIFGKKHLSWRCFWRSCVASVVAVIIVTFIWAALRPSQFISFVQHPTFLLNLFIIPVAVAMMNFLPDYLSLFETRYVIRWMSGNISAARVFTLLMFDFIATFAFGCVAWAALILVFLVRHETWLTIRVHYFKLFVESILPLSTSYEGPLSPGIWFYSTFFTSFWVWLYAISGLVVKLAGYLGIGFNRLKWFLDIENKPLHSLGIISMLLVTLLYLVGAGFYRLVGS